MKGRVRYVSNKAQFAKAVTEIPNYVVQELVLGKENYCLNALLDHGKPLAAFTHRELREYPPTGGSATVAESIPQNEVTRMGLEILQRIRWHEPAQVEFKKDTRNGSYKLMEINPRFWASIELAIACGVDFPLLTIKLARGEEIEPVTTYRTGVRFRWLVEDTLQLAENVNSLPTYLTDFASPTMRYDIRLHDLMPNVFEASKYLFWSAQKRMRALVAPTQKDHRRHDAKTNTGNMDSMNG